jgi:transcriptional regulator with XRE-family HTH domain
MIAANKLIDKAKALCEGDSYAALARSLNVTPQTVHQWKNGDVPLPTERIVEIAKIARVPIDEWVMLILTDQSKGEARKALEGITRRLGYAAAVVLCVMGLAGGAAPAHSAGRSAQAMHIM